MGTGVDFLQYLDERMELEEVDLREYSPLVLAYIGDSVFDLVVRTVLVKQHNCPVQKLHRRASALVRATAQAEMIDALLPLLTEEEARVYKRGRNAKPFSRAKNASMHDYNKATGFEALMGYLYLRKDTARMMDLMRLGLEQMLPDGIRERQGQAEHPDAERSCEGHSVEEDPEGEHPDAERLCERHPLEEDPDGEQR